MHLKDLLPRWLRFPLHRDQFQMQFVLTSSQFLLTEQFVNRLQTLLLAYAPAWCSGLGLEGEEFEDGTTYSEAIALHMPDSLFDALISKEQQWAAASAEHGEFTESFIRRRLLNEGLVGLHSCIRVGLTFDEAPLVTEWRDPFASSVFFELTCENFEGWVASEWILEVATELAKEGWIDFGYAAKADEYNFRNMVVGPSTYAVLPSQRAALPGIYWLNVYGPAYIEMFGSDRLLSAPAHSVRRVGPTVFLQLAETPDDWRSGTYARRERAVIRHLGSEHFFNRRFPKRILRTPDFSADHD